MGPKRKSVTFHENVSIYPKDFDGSLSPAPINPPLATAAQPLTLDPMYVTWLRSATKVHFPFIVNGTFATHVYRQNFDEHVRIKTVQELQRAQGREAAVPALAEKYGSLGWGNLYREVSEKAWVKNYREIYRFDGSDEHLLQKIEEAYAEIKHAIAHEENVQGQFTQGGSLYSSLPDRQWESVTQGGGALISPDLGPGGVNVRMGAPFDEDDFVQFRGRNYGGNGYGIPFSMDVVRRGFGNARLNAGNEARILSTGP